MQQQHKILFFTMTGCVVVDQITKYIAQAFLQGKQAVSFFGDMARLVYSENTGAFLGLGANLAPEIRTLIFSVVVGIFLLGFLIYTLKNDSKHHAGLIGSAFLIGGGLSNLIDRLVNNGAVIDFMNVGIGTLRTGIFNIADMAILLGAFMMVWYKPSERQVKSS